MDENNIQLLREDLTEEFYALARSHTTAIEQVLEDFNDDQMLFRLEAEAYEQERIYTKSQAATATQNIAPTMEEQASEPLATTHTTEARQEEPVLANINPPAEHQTEQTTL